MTAFMLSKIFTAAKYNVLVVYIVIYFCFFLLYSMSLLQPQILDFNR